MININININTQLIIDICNRGFATLQELNIR
jgi:hypothetical protein